MKCALTALANPDIAGFGVGQADPRSQQALVWILVSFVTQTLIAVLVSIYAWNLSTALVYNLDGSVDSPCRYRS